MKIICWERGMELPGIKGLIFDLDGTLVNTLPACYHGFRAALGKHLGREFSDREIAALFGPSEEGIFKRLLPGDWQAGLADYLREYERAHETVRLFAGIESALNWLWNRHFPLAIVSGKGAGSMAITLDHFRLNRFFNPVVTGSESGAAKPAHLRQVLHQWQLDPAAVAYVGDTAYDIRAAREVGLTALGAVWAETADLAQVKAQQPDALFPEVADLVRWLRTALGDEDL